MGRRIRSGQERLIRWEVSGSQTRQDGSLKWRQWWWREAVTGTIGPGGGRARLAAGSPEAGRGKMKGRIPLSGMETRGKSGSSDHDAVLKFQGDQEICNAWKQLTSLVAASAVASERRQDPASIQPEKRKQNWALPTGISLRRRLTGPGDN